MFTSSGCPDGSSFMLPLWGAIQGPSLRFTTVKCGLHLVAFLLILSPLRCAESPDTSSTSFALTTLGSAAGALPCNDSNVNATHE